MKNLFFIFLGTLMLFSCSSEPNETPSNDKQNAFGKEIVKALSKKDSTGYSKLFVTKKEYSQTINSSSLSEDEQKNKLKHVDTEMKAILKSVGTSFRNINGTRDRIMLSI